MSLTPSARSNLGFTIDEHLYPLATSYPANSCGCTALPQSMTSVLCHTSSYSTFAPTGSPTRVVKTGTTYLCAAFLPRRFVAMLKK